MQKLRLPIAPLTRQVFRAYGEVIETEGAERFETNAGYAERFHDLARIDCAAAGGRPALGIFRARPFPLPLRVQMMERHPISSQAFVPMGPATCLIIVAEASARPEPTDLKGFLSNGRQGVNYRPGTWHHPLVVLGPADFLVVDRQGPGKGHDQDYEECRFDDCEILADIG
jgi:ureidoglycolate lyase